MKNNWNLYPLGSNVTKTLRLAKATLLFLMVFLLNMSANAFTLNKRYTITMRDVAIKEVLNRIEMESDVSFFYQDESSVRKTKVTVNFENSSLTEILDQLFSGTSLTYQILDKYVAIIDKEKMANQQDNLTVSGRVVDANGEPIPGATVVVKGTTTGTITDMDGNFTLAGVPEEAVLAFSFVGMKTQEINVGNQTSFNVQMFEESIGLDEVVAIGYGTMKKSDLTGAVGSVSGDDLGEVSSDAFGRALSGKIAGVQIQQTTGAPGGNLVVRVRGTSSLSAGNDPLYVIDGFPVQNDGLGTTDQGFNPLSSINPDDIESIEVLKDASAAAIYGSRGANGVVIVTTKRGRKGAPKLSFNTSFGVQSIINKIDLLNSGEFIDLVKDAYQNAANSSDPGIAFPTFLNRENELRSVDTDWQDQIFRQALVQNYQLSADGGTDLFQYFVSGNYLNEEGIVLSSGFERFSLRTNFDLELTNFLRLGLNFTPSYTINDEVRAEGHWAGNGVINQSLINFPFLKPNESSEDFVNNDPTFACCGVPNPVQTAKDLDAESTQTRLLSTVDMEVDLAENFMFKTSIGFDLSEWERNEFNPAHIKRNNDDHSASSRKLSRKSYLTENIFTYKNEFNNHNINALGGFTFQESRVQDNYIEANKLTNDIVRTINDFNTVVEASSNIEQWSLISFIGRLNYSYKNKYLLTATVRSDGSSRFGENNRYATFPSLSLGWVVSEEQFFSGIDGLSRLKIRASYGKSGNNSIGNYSSYNLLSGSSYVFGSGNGVSVSGLQADNIGNPNLTWETTRQSNFGAEFGFIDNRLYVTGEYYNSETEGLLLQVPIPAITGFTSALQNLGKVKNSGVEISLNSRNLQGPIEWNTGFNISFNKNEILELGPEGDPIIAGSGAGNVFLNEIGGELGAFYVYEQEGIFQTEEEINNSATWETNRGTYPGDVKYKNQNDDKVINSDDKVVVGSNNPDYTWGLTNSLSFKNFDLNIVINGVQGNKVHNVARRFYNNLEGNQNQTVDALNRWRSVSEPGDGSTPRANRVTSGNNNVPESSRWIEDASFTRIQNLTLGYKFQNSMIERWRISSLRVYGSVSNLAYFTKYSGYNPEVSFSGGSALTKGSDYGSYPLSRRFTLGLKVIF